jgi:hypothetical protein
MNGSWAREKESYSTVFVGIDRIWLEESECYHLKSVTVLIFCSLFHAFFAATFVHHFEVKKNIGTMMIHHRVHTTLGYWLETQHQLRFLLIIIVLIKGSRDKLGHPMCVKH